MPHPWKTTILAAVTCLVCRAGLLAQQAAVEATAQPETKAAAKPADTKDSPPAPTDPIERIKEEGLKRSRVMATLSHLTDVIGPRLTGSPNLKQANEWTRDTMTEWGLENAHLEAWGPFGRGWTLRRFSAQIVEPQCIPLIAYPKAWSPGTAGPVVGEVVHFEVKTEADFAKYKGKLKGAIVLTGAAPEVPAHFEPLATRLTEKELLALADADPPGERGRRQGPPREVAKGEVAKGEVTKSEVAKSDTAGNPPAATNGQASRNGPASTNGSQPSGERRPAFDPASMQAERELAVKKAKFLAEEGVAILIDPSRQGDGGTLFVAQASVPVATPSGPSSEPGAKRVSAWDKDAPAILPQIVLSKEHYNRLVRMIAAGQVLKMSVDLAVQFHDDDLMAYNTVAEIPGTDLKDEVVMLGGHMDSWHGGTGATDNAAGVAVAMEAARILKALDLKPRRTVRVGLWTGEEQGLLGSRAYVTQHFGKTPRLGGFGGPERPASEAKAEPEPAPTPEFEKFSAYFNLDNGTGKIRGVYLQGNEAVRPIFRKWLQPFRDMSATTLSIANTGGTDHQAFDGIGLPGFQFIQDQIEYNTRTHHSNQDVFDRIQADDMKQAAVILAAFVYDTAMLDQKLPRKPASR